MKIKLSGIYDKFVVSAMGVVPKYSDCWVGTFE